MVVMHVSTLGNTRHKPIWLLGPSAIRSSYIIGNDNSPRPRRGAK